MKFIAIANMKGGVAKTTTTVTLAETLAAIYGKKVLVVDLDTQANATACLIGGTETNTVRQKGATIDKYFSLFSGRTQRKPLEEFGILETSNIDFDIHNLGGFISLIPASSRLHGIERNILDRVFEQYSTVSAYRDYLAEFIKADLNQIAQKGNFDFAIFDMPPGISIFAEVFLSMADTVIIPTVPDYMSLSGIEDFKNLLRGNRVLSADIIDNNTFILPTKAQNIPVHRNTLAKISLQSEKYGRVFRLRNKNDELSLDSEGNVKAFSITQHNKIPEATQNAMGNGMSPKYSFETKYGGANSNLKMLSRYFIDPTYTP